MWITSQHLINCLFQSYQDKCAINLFWKNSDRATLFYFLFISARENRVSRLFSRGDSLASKKSKSTDFGFFLYLLAKTVFCWLFSQNNCGKKVSNFYWHLTSILVRIEQRKTAGKEKSTKVSFAVSNRETRFFCWKKILRFFVAKPSINVLGYMEGFERNFWCFGCETQKSVLGDMERYKKFLKKFELRPSTFTKNCAWLSREIFLRRCYYERINLWQTTSHRVKYI